MQSNRKSGRTTKIINDYVEEILAKGELKDISDHSVLGEELEFMDWPGITDQQKQDACDYHVLSRIKQRLKEYHFWRWQPSQVYPNGQQRDGYWRKERLQIRTSRKYKSLKIINDNPKDDVKGT